MVLWLWLNRPHRLNAVSEAVHERLTTALEHADADGARAVVIAGKGRGDAPLDRAAIVDLLLQLSALARAESAIEQVDLNPVLLYPDGAVVVDARILLGSASVDRR